MNQDKNSLLVAEYVLGLLDKPEAQSVEKQLRSDRKIQKVFVEWSEYLMTFHNDKDARAPPRKLKAKIQKRLFG